MSDIFYTYNNTETNHKFRLKEIYFANAYVTTIKTLSILLILTFFTSEKITAKNELEQQIIALEKQKKFPQIIEILEQKLYKEKPDEPRKIKLSLLLMKAYKDNRDFEDLLALFDNFSELKKGKIDPELNLALVMKSYGLYFLKNYDLGLEVANKVIRSSREINDSIGLYKGLVCKTLIQNQRHRTFEDPVIKYITLDDALVAVEEAQEVIKDIDDESTSYADAFTSLGITFDNLQQFEKGRYFFNKALRIELDKEVLNYNYICLQYNNLAASTNSEFLHEKALAYLDSTKAYPQEKIANTTLTYLYTNYYWAYLELKNLEKAEAYLDSFTKLKEKIVQERSEKKLNESLLRFANEKEQILLQNEKKNRSIYYQNLFLGFAIIGSIISLAALIKLLKNEQKRHQLVKEKFLSEKKLLGTQLNASFIYNNISTTQELINQNQHHQAAKHLGVFSTYIRTILENSTRSLVSLESEIISIENYIKLKSKTFDIQFSVDNQIDEFDFQDINISPMIIQPIVEHFMLRNKLHQLSSNLILTLSLEKNNRLICNFTDTILNNDLNEPKLKNVNASDFFFNEAKRLKTINIKSDLKYKELNTKFLLTIPVTYS